MYNWINDINDNWNNNDIFYILKGDIMKGSPGRKDQRNAQKISLTRNFGSQCRDFFKAVKLRRKKKVAARIARRINR